MDPLTDDMARALARLADVLPRCGPELWASLGGPVSDDDLEALRGAVAPFVLPAELVLLLRTHDGQPEHQGTRLPWWPSMDMGPLLPARVMAEGQLQLREHVEPWQWSRAWLSISREGWWQSVLDLSSPQGGVVVDASWPDLPRVVAPSLVHVLDGVSTLAEAGLLDEHEQDVALGPARDSLLAELWADAWAHSPYPPRTEIDPGTWPAAWGGPHALP